MKQEVHKTKIVEAELKKQHASRKRETVLGVMSTRPFLFNLPQAFCFRIGSHEPEIAPTNIIG
jgi:hypothetical protein